MYQQQVRLWPARLGGVPHGGCEEQGGLVLCGGSSGYFLMAGLASDGGVGFIPEGNGDRPGCLLAVATSWRHSPSQSPRHCSRR